MTNVATNPEELLPLTPRVFHILLALVDGPEHGYQIMTEVEVRSGGKVRIGPGTLYEGVQRLVKNGLIEESSERPETELDDRRRRYYQLTSLGQQTLEAEADRLADLVGFARSKKLVNKGRAS